MSKLFDELVQKRGFSEKFLNPKYEDLPSPWLLPDMKEAIDRIKKAKQNKEKIIIYGDYDADGVTASTVVKTALELAGLEGIETMLPDRFKDGYGMSEKVGTIMLGDNQGEVFLGRDLAQSKEYSEETASIIDAEVKKIVDKGYKTAEEILKANIDKLHAVAGVLLEKEKIGGEEFEEIFKS